MTLALKMADIEYDAYENGFERGHKAGLQVGIQQGIEQGIEQANINNAKNFLKLGVDVEIIVQATGLSKEKVLELKKEI